MTLHIVVKSIAGINGADGPTLTGDVHYLYAANYISFQSPESFTRITIVRHTIVQSQ